MCTADAPRQTSARGRDRFHEDRGFGDAETRAAIGFRHADAEPAGIGDGAAELLGKLAVAVALEPIVVIEARADFFHGVAQ